MEKLADIKDFTQVSDYSFYLFIFLCLLALLIVGFLVYKIFHFFKHKQKSKREIALEVLKNIDFSNSKKASYAISKYGAYLPQNEAGEEFLQRLNEKLAKYKYQKIVPEFSDEDRKEFKAFMDLCDD